MKRPQGFDRSSAPAEPPATPAAPRESAPSGPSSGRQRERARDRRSDAPREDAPREETPRAVSTMTEPIPLVRRQEDSPYASLPSNREITKALREARKERKRVERGEVRRFTKRSRRRRLAWIGAAGVVVLLVLGVVAVAFSPLLALRHVQVVGASRLDPKTIATKLDDQVGTPLPLLDQAAISADLAAFPLIRSYTLESHPPDTLVVRIVERQPIGVIRQGAAFTLVDAAKVPISSSATRPAGFPLIAASGASEETNADSGFAAAASVLSALPASLLGQVDTITAKTKDDVSFTLRGNRATVVWGSAEDSALKAADLAALLKSAGGSTRYDVSSPHSVTTG
ncbi:FtsQ-type POTRA domain-containing protein [Leifsonia sp. NPDC080035]|uniref:FtsQ-type POTRA domain-containing protein n=1 Tax=Leifsonia sp. NPDC080035 TaxID=3143936 RepID=A0AAU7GCF0_9MICO